MLDASFFRYGFEISNAACCDFSKLISHDNASVLKKDLLNNHKMADFLEKKMGVQHRYHCPKNKHALDLAKEALDNLLKLDGSLVDEADFIIYAGISNPLPTATHSTLLAYDYKFKKASCWDIKSGCSSGLLGLIQAVSWLNMGAKRGVLVASETLSKYANPDILQMAATVGDGAIALALERSEKYKIKAIAHGTNARYAKSMQVPGVYPPEKADNDSNQYYYKFDNKGATSKYLTEAWVNSLRQLLGVAQIKGQDVQHYIAHQVDLSRNNYVARECLISEMSQAQCFKKYGNMGAPTIFINYYEWIKNNKFSVGDNIVWQAVGGGISWAAMCLNRVK